jgi:hypothetical protein
MKQLIKHETKRFVLIKFSLVLLVFLAYTGFVIWKYGAKDGLLVSFLTWSFFVFCTPIADAGFLFDFPIRLITGMKMIYSEILVWTFAFLLNLYALIFKPEIYEKTLLLKLFKFILTHPFPYWLIIILSFIGTFLSVYFGDELLDVVTHKERIKYFLYHDKYKILLFIFLIAFILVLYDFLLKELNINIL